MSYYAACCCSRYVALVPCKGQVGTTYTTTATVWSTNFGITDFGGVWLVEVGGSKWCAEFQAAETAGTEPTGISISGVSGCGDAACGDPEYFLFDPCSEGECLFQMAATNADWGALLGLPEPAPGLPYDLSGVWKFVPSVANEECCGLVKPCNPFCGEISPTPLVDPVFCDASCPDCNVPDDQIKLIDSSFTLGTFEEVEGSCGSAPECQQCQSDPCDKPYLKVTGTTRFKISCDLAITGSVQNGPSINLGINGAHTATVKLDVAVEWEHYLNANAIRMDPEDWSAGTPICDRVYNKHAVAESYIRNITFNQNQIQVLSSINNSGSGEVYETEGEFKLFQDFPNNNTEGLSIECGDIYKRQYVCSDSICRSVIPPEDICDSPGCYATFGNKLNGTLGVDLVSTTTLDNVPGGPYTCTGVVQNRTPTFSVWSMLLNPNAYACCCDHNYFLTEDCFLATGDGRHLGWNWTNIYNLLELNVFGPPGSPDPVDPALCEDYAFETFIGLPLINANGGNAVIDFDGNVQDFVAWSGNRCLIDLEFSEYGPCFDGLSNPVINCNRDLGETSWEWNASQYFSFRPPGYLTGQFNRLVVWQMLQTETVLGIECVDSLP